MKSLHKVDPLVQTIIDMKNGTSENNSTTEQQLNEAKEKSVVFTFGRFNPPTIGHELLIKQVEKIAKRERIKDFRIYPSHTQNNKKDPLSHKDKVKLLRKMFPNFSKNIISDQKIKSPHHVAQALSDKGFKRVIMVVGSDRVREFQDSIGKYVGKESDGQPYHFTEFKVISAGERSEPANPDEISVKSMSASRARKFASDGDFKNFKKSLPKTISDKEKESTFKKIRKGLNLKECLENKSKKYGIEYRILDEIYDRGLNEWETKTDPKHTQDQFAFNRVNSFIAKGLSWKETDKDLRKVVLDEKN